ncbi:MAG: LuxR C-terminal-related transcriptional regulator, partial [Acidimicrobiales bacterium]
TAAQWAEQHGDLDQALRYHLRQLDRAPATGFARRHLPGLIARGQISRHRSWVAQFPNEWIEADAELLLCRAEAEVFGIEPQQALRDLDEVERLVGHGGSTIAAGRVELRRAMATFFAGDYQTCLDNAARSLDLIGEREPELSAVAHLYRGVVYSFRDDRDTASQELNLAATQAERGGNHYAALSARMSLGALAIHAGDLDQASYRFEAIEAMATTITTTGPEFPLRGAADVGLGLVSFERLDLNDASTRFRRGLHQLRATTAIDYTLVGYCRWADTATLTGNSSEATEILSEATDYVEHFAGNAPPHMTRALATAEVRTHLARGDLERAREIERRAHATPDQRRGELLHPTFELCVLSVRLHLAAGDLDAAKAEARKLGLPDANDVGLEIERAVIATELALASADPDRAHTFLTKALTLADPGRLTRPFAEAGGEVQKMAIDQNPSWAPLLAASGASRQAANTSGQRPQPLVVPLTARELEVLSEIVDGRTNAEIAERLYISVGTTKRHIANIFTKLDVSHRTEAAAHARRLGIIT